MEDRSYGVDLTLNTEPGENTLTISTRQVIGVENKVELATMLLDLHQNGSISDDQLRQQLELARAAQNLDGEISGPVLLIGEGQDHAHLKLLNCKGIRPIYSLERLDDELNRLQGLTWASKGDVERITAEVQQKIDAGELTLLEKESDVPPQLASHIGSRSSMMIILSSGGSIPL